MKLSEVPLFILSISLLMSAPSFALPLEDDYLIYLEDFVDESGFPTIPEIDVNDQGGAGGFAVGIGVTNPLPLLGESVLLQIDEGDVGLARVIHGINLNSSSSFSTRADFKGFAGLPVSSTVTVSVTYAFSPSPLQVSVGAGIAIEFVFDEFGVATARLVLAESETRTTMVENRFESSVPIPAAIVNALLDGAPFILDFGLDRGSFELRGSLAVSGGAPLIPPPLPYSFLNGRDVLIASANLADPLFESQVDVQLTRLQTYQPFGWIFSVDDVGDLVDAAPGDGNCVTSRGTCSLRAAIQEANAVAGPSLVELPNAPCCVLSRAGANEDASIDGDLDVLRPIEIRGKGTSTSVIDGGGLDRVFHIPQSAEDTELRLSDLTIQNGVALSAPSEAGGGIDSWGRLRLSRCIVRNNDATVGGGIASRRLLDMSDCVVSHNTAFGSGGSGRAGGIAAAANSMAASDPESWIRRSALVNNEADRVDQAEFADSARVRIEESTWSGDGALDQVNFLRSSARLRQVTGVSGSGRALSGGAVGAPALRTLEFVNSAFEGGPACDLDPAGPSFQKVYAGHNASNDLSCGFVAAGSVEGVDLLLEPLATIGESQGHAPTKGTSPLVDAADPLLCRGEVDQTGGARPLDGLATGVKVCDIGAIEVPEPTSAVMFTVGGGWVLWLSGIRSRRKWVRVLALH